MANSNVMLEDPKSNVILKDPNSININTDMINSIPDYQDMYIFAELIAESKGRTVITIGNVTGNDSEKINFLGNNQDDVKYNNPNRLYFTTNYYDGSTGNQTNYESFGINNIKIVINSSFIPQINIQFIDIRGLSFFNQTDSPYRILFDFPPPIFTLTVKGYYGNTITYKLHLVKYTSEFKSENGNFIIDAQFVAVTFAPLADILFRYIINTPLINNEESMKPSTNQPPKNTYELIMKLKNLYTSISDKLETSTENKQYFSVQTQIETIVEINKMLQAIIDNQNEVLQIPGTRPYLMVKTPKDPLGYSLVKSPATQPTEKYNLQIIETLSEYNEFIKAEETTGIKNTLENRLYIAYLAGTNLSLIPEDYNPHPYSIESPEPVVDAYFYPTKNYSGFKTTLTTFSKSLTEIVLPAFNIKTGDVAIPEPFTNGINVINNNIEKTEYYGMDITEYYYKIYKKNQSLTEEKEDLSMILSKIINNMVTQLLGMTPSIYNIFEVILNDVDIFFSKLSKISKDADKEHNTDESIRIISNNHIDSPISKGNIPDHIYPFPLIIEDSPVYGGFKKERVAPIELNKKISFPELDLVGDFMDTFILQKNRASQYEARKNQNDDGTFKWIPISPLDSILGGATPESPYLNINDNVRAEITNTLLERFYVLSQGSIFNTFYGESSNVRTAYIELYANAEAINIVSTLISKQNAATIQLMADKYSKNVQDFYDYAETLTTKYNDGTLTGKTGNLINFPTKDPKSFVVTPSQPYQGQAYVDKNNPDFSGLNWYTSDVVIQDTNDTSNPIDKFGNDAKNNWIKKISQGDTSESIYYKFTQENVIFFRDIDASDKISNYVSSDNGLSMSTRYLINATNSYAVSEKYFPSYDLNTNQKIAYRDGNNSFSPIKTKDKRALRYSNRIFDVWKNPLANYAIVDLLTGSTNLSTVLILSNFGNTAGPFNIYPNGLNNLIFQTPAAIEVPEYYAPYIGALLTAIDDNWVNEILTLFTGTTGINESLLNAGLYVLADLHDVQEYLSNKDKETLMEAYTDYCNNLHGTIVGGIINMCDFVRKNTKQTPNDDKMFLSEQVAYNYVLNPQPYEIKNAESKGEYSWIMEELMKRKILVNFSQITFEMIKLYPKGYMSIASLNNSEENPDFYENAKLVNQLFFQKLFTRISKDISNKILELKDEEKALKKAKGDKDIINQLYYSFKNINDKWLTGNQNSKGEYPYNKPNKKLINSFVFVDRGMNPIGDTIINAEILIDMFDNPNISLFTVLSQLLSLNGFEFFPLQNFMSFEKNSSWEDSFKIQTGAISTKNSTAFVCMYIGGSSSYPSVSGNGFVNDGIIDISEPGVMDYYTSTANTIQNTTNDKQLENTDFPWRQVRAFRVRFGEQNQSMFTDIKIDSKEYPETNESIQILSRLAGDNNPDTPVPKGQNLYNLYENRSYKATVTGFGNAMIQPTQYFQLENIPLFNGAYIILNVEHNITANKMTTSFSGTKLLKYPIPRVLNPMAFTSYIPNQTPGETVITTIGISNNEETHFNSMYDNTSNSLKIE